MIKGNLFKNNLTEQLFVICMIILGIMIISLGIILPSKLIPVYETNVYNYLRQPLSFLQSEDDINAESINTEVAYLYISSSDMISISDNLMSVIDIKNAFDKEEEKLEKQYCNKKTNVIKFTKRLRKKFKTYFYRKKSIKSFENNMIDFNKEFYDNNENNEFISQNSDYRNLGSLSLSTGDDEISLSEERTNISVNNVECDYYQNQNFLSYYCLFSNYPCDK